MLVRGTGRPSFFWSNEEEEATSTPRITEAETTAMNKKKKKRVDDAWRCRAVRMMGERRKEGGREEEEKERKMSYMRRPRLKRLRCCLCFVFSGLGCFCFLVFFLSNVASAVKIAGSQEEKETQTMRRMMRHNGVARGDIDREERR